MSSGWLDAGTLLEFYQVVASLVICLLLSFSSLFLIAYLLLFWQEGSPVSSGPREGASSHLLTPLTRWMSSW